MKELQIVVFSLNGQLFGADAAQIHHIINCRNINKVPGLPEFIEGTIEMQGEEVPVINLCKRFGLHSMIASANAKVLVVRDGDKQAGYLVDEVKEILHLTEADLVPLPPVLRHTAEECFANVIMKDDLLFSLVDLIKVLKIKEVVSMLEEAAACRD